MKKSIFLFALLFIAFFGFNRGMAIELDTVWVSDINGQVLFQHPVTKNILVATNGGITELNSQDGKLVRSFPFIISGNDLSPDGNLILMSGSDTKIFDFITLEEKYVILKSTNARFLDNNTIIYRTVGENIIVKYNLQTKEKKEITPPIGGITALATSPNGKYIAYAKYEQNNTTDSKAHLYLLDAETMKGLGELGSWENIGNHNIREILFSSDSKFLTYSPTSFNGDFPINIYNTDNFKISKSITLFNFQFETCGVIFLDSEYYIIRGMNLFNETTEVRICSFKTHEVIYKTNDFSKFIQTAKFDTEKKYLFCNTPADKTFCFNLNNIISGVAPVVPIKIEYSNKTLIINNYEKPIYNISIMSVEGREFYLQNFLGLVNMNNPIEIPLELSNGSYFITFKTNEETFTEKIMVVE
jgi:WD40 repeat protein